MAIAGKPPTIWQADKLLSVERHVTGQQPDDVTLRFDHQGNLNFMQRQLAGRREAVSADSVELYRFDAQRMLAQSNALLSGRVLLRQGTGRAVRRFVTVRGSR